MITGDKKFLFHTACDHCGSKDNRGVYEDAKGFNSTCFGCQNYQRHESLDGLEPSKPVTNRRTDSAVTDHLLQEIAQWGSIESVERKIPAVVNKKYGVVQKDGKRAYPYTVSGSVVGYKVRELPKSFYCVGQVSGNVELFGQSLFQAGGRWLIITAGEEDAIAAYRMTAWKKSSGGTEGGYPAVSLPRGASDKKAIRDNIEWINSFEKVIFAVDQEELDLTQAMEMSALLAPGKAYIARFPFKDASEMCQAGKFSLFCQSIWNASLKKPSGIVEGEEIWSHWKKKDNYEAVSFPESWGMNSWDYGIYSPSLCVLTAGTGVGKSTWMKSLQLHLFHQTDDSIGVISMEEPIALCSGVLMGMELGKRIMLPDVEYTENEIKGVYEKLFESQRFVFCENVGIRTPEDLYNKIRFMAIARNCKYIFLDHLTAIVNKFETGKGSKNDHTELLVNTLNDLCQELEICLILVSHVRKTSTDSDETYETGKVPTEDSIFGSSAIKQYSHKTIALSRNKRDNPSPVFVHVLKDRLSGKVGRSNPIVFDEETGNLYGVAPAEEPETEDFI